MDQLNTQIFRPFALNLRRYLQNQVAAKENTSPVVAVPAADRIVTLNDNEPVYSQTMIALANLKVALQQANDYPDPDEKDRHVAEISATTELLKALRVRVEAVVAVATSVFKYIAQKFTDGLISAVAKTAWEGIKSMLGL